MALHTPASDIRLLCLTLCFQAAICSLISQACVLAILEFVQPTTRHLSPYSTSCRPQNEPPLAFRRLFVQSSYAQCCGPITIPSKTTMLTEQLESLTLLT